MFCSHHFHLCVVFFLTLLIFLYFTVTCFIWLMKMLTWPNIEIYIFKLVSEALSMTQYRTDLSLLQSHIHADNISMVVRWRSKQWRKQVDFDLFKTLEYQAWNLDRLILIQRPSMWWPRKCSWFVILLSSDLPFPQLNTK